MRKSAGLGVEVRGGVALLHVAWGGWLRADIWALGFEIEHVNYRFFIGFVYLRQLRISRARYARRKDNAYMYVYPCPCLM